MERLSTKRLADLAGVDARTVKARCLEAGLEPEPGERRAQLWPSDEALRAIYNGGRDGEQLDAQQEKARLDRARRIAQELANAKLRGELIEIDKVVEIVSEDYSNLRSKLLALPMKLAGPLAKAPTVKQCHLIVQDGIYGALEELSSYDESKPQSEAPKKVNGHAVKSAEPKKKKKTRRNTKGGSRRQTKASPQKTARGK